MAEIGNILREARIQMGLSLKDVSEITKIRTKYLEALEEDAYHQIPGPTFVKAYLRSYASLLRLDPDAVVEEYRNTFERRRGDPTDTYDLTLEQVRTRSARKKSRKFTRRGRQGYALIGVVVILVVILLAWFGSNRGQPEARLGAESVGGSASSTATTQPAPSTTDTTEVGATTTSSTEAVFTGSDVWLRVKATADCFLIVRDDNQEGELLYRDTMTADEEFGHTRSKRYWLLIGSPDSVRVWINEAEYNVEGEGGMFIVTETGIDREQ
jgi:cytoskeletal protein RodZ